MKLLLCKGYLIEEQGMTYLANRAACTYRIALGPRAVGCSVTLTWTTRHSSFLSQGGPAKTNVRRLPPRRLNAALARLGRSRSAGAGNPIRPLDTNDSHRPR